MVRISSGDLLKSCKPFQLKKSINFKFRRPPNYEESRDQMLVVSYLHLKHPGILFTSALGGTHTSIQKAVRAKRMGYCKSWPDLTFAEPRGPYHGLVVEMKKTGGKMENKDQEDILKAFRDRGYKAVCCIGYEVAVKVIDTYLKHGR